MVEAEPIDALVVGAGISGLVCAFRLKQLGRKVIVVEQHSRAGGVLNSERLGGFLLEWGAHTVGRSHELERLIDELNLRSEVVAPPETVRNRFLTLPDVNGRLKLQAAPLSLAQALSTPLLSLSAKLRVLRDLFAVRPNTDDVTVAEFISQRFGKEVLESVVAPALNGVWAADVERLSAKYSLPRLWAAQERCGSALRGMMRRSPGTPKRLRGIFSFRQGMCSLPQALADSLRAELLEAHTVRSLTFPEHGLPVAQLAGPRDDRVVTARTVVIAAGARETGALLGSDTIRTVPYSSVGLLQLAYPKSAIPHPLDGFGVLIAPKYGRALLGGIFTSSLFPERAPDGAHLISCFVGGARHPELAEVESPTVQQRVIGELGELLGATVQPTIVGARVMREAIPSFELGHGALRAEADQLERQIPSLKLLGSWREGISVPDRVRLAEAAAQAVNVSLR